MKDKRELVQRLGQGYIPRGWSKDPTRLGWSSPKGRKFIGDIEVFNWIADHTCAICGDGPDLDIRYLHIDCFYDLTEVSGKFQQIKGEPGTSPDYVLSFCKPCRGHFMFEVLAKWVESKGHKEHPNWNGESLIQFV